MLNMIPMEILKSNSVLQDQVLNNDIKNAMKWFFNIFSYFLHDFMISN